MSFDAEAPSYTEMSRITSILHAINNNNIVYKITALAIAFSWSPRLENFYRDPGQFFLLSSSIISGMYWDFLVQLRPQVAQKTLNPTYFVYL